MPAPLTSLLLQWPCYGSGNVDLNVTYAGKQRNFKHTKGLALSFYADKQVQFVHTVSANKPLQCVLIATATRNLDQLPNQEGELFADLLEALVNPVDHYVEGPQFFMPPRMQAIVDQIFDNQFAGKTKMMFFRSQITALLSYFFGHLSTMRHEVVKPAEREKLVRAKGYLVQKPGFTAFPHRIVKRNRLKQF